MSVLGTTSNNLKLQVSNPAEGLEKVLSEQLELYETYTNCLKADRDLMANLRIDEIEKNNKTKSTVLLKIQTMDEARRMYVKQLAAEKGISEAGVKVVDLCKGLSSPQAARLLHLRDRLQIKIDGLKQLQQHTSLLANASLAWVNSSMATLKSLLTPTGTYNLQGKVDHPTAFSGRVVEKQA